MNVVDTGYVEASGNAVGPSITGYCRVCGKVADDLLSIYQNEIVQELPTKLTTYLPIKISTTDVFPVEICLDCTNGVQNWHLLYQSCLYADMKFREMLEVQVKQQVEQLADKSHNSRTIEIIDNQVLIKEEPSESRVSETLPLSLELKEEADLMDFSAHEVDIKPTEECQLVSYTVQEIEENHSDSESIVECYSVEPIEIDDSDDEETDIGEPSCSIVKEEVDLGVAVYDDSTSKVPPSRENFDIGKEDEEIDSSKSERFLLCKYPEIIQDLIFDNTIYREARKQIGPFSCFKCKIFFDFKRNYCMHLLVNHGKDPGIFVEPEGEENIEDIIKSSKITTDGKILYVCKICKKELKNARNFKYHYKQHTAVNPYKCYFCGCDFKRLNFVSRHIKIVHLNLNNAQCQYCSRKYREICSVDYHIQSHLGLEYKCPICGKPIKRKFQLGPHVQSHLVSKDPKIKKLAVDILEILKYSM